MTIAMQIPGLDEFTECRYTVTAAGNAHEISVSCQKHHIRQILVMFRSQVAATFEGKPVWLKAKMFDDAYPVERFVILVEMEAVQEERRKEHARRSGGKKALVRHTKENACQGGDSLAGVG